MPQITRRSFASCTLLLTAAASADTVTFISSGVSDAGSFGSSVAHLNDVNGDGYADLLIGGPNDDIGALNAAGKAYVFSGKTGQIIRTHQSPNIEAEGWFGETVIAIPDINGDGRDDYAISAPNEGNFQFGNIYVYSGANGAHLYTIAGPGFRSGGALGVAPDCSGDGLPELIVGYAGPFGGDGSVHVYQAKNGQSGSRSFHPRALPGWASALPWPVCRISRVTERAMSSSEPSDGTTISSRFRKERSSSTTAQPESSTIRSSHPIR